jgi:threonine synthase
MTSFVTDLVCPRCASSFDPTVPHTVCHCGSPLLVRYDLERIGRVCRREGMVDRPPTMWRYRELLPVEDPAQAVTLGEGLTPLLRVERLGRRIGLPNLWIKDEGLNPTGTFKARGASVGVSRARELGIEDVALATAGNAGGAWACYGAAAGIRVHVVMPSDAPEANRLECLLAGADLRVVDGLISDAGRAVAEGAARNGWFDVGALREPYRIEGKKTLGLELAEQMGWRMPDAVVYPAGGGVGIIGIWRGLQQLQRLGWVQGDLPRLSIVQASGCAPLIRAFHEGLEEAEPWQGAMTIAAGLRVPKPLGDFLVLRAVRETGGTAVAVDDTEILRMMFLMAERAGVLSCPEGAATLAGAIRMRERGDLRQNDAVVLVVTGSAAKYPDAIRSWAARVGADPGDSNRSAGDSSRG